MRVTLLLVTCLLVVATSASADPKRYGGIIFQEVSERMSYTDINNDGQDDDGSYMLHTTMMEKVTGLGQETKLCEL